MFCIIFYIKKVFPKQNYFWKLWENNASSNVLLSCIINYSGLDLGLSSCMSRSLVELNTKNLACWITGCYDLYMTQSNQVTQPARFFSWSQSIVFLLNIEFNHILILLGLRNLVNHRLLHVWSSLFVNNLCIG